MYAYAHVNPELRLKPKLDSDFFILRVTQR